MSSEKNVSTEKYEFPYFDNNEYIVDYKGNADEEIEKPNTIVWDTFLTSNEISAIHSSINLLGDKLDNTCEDEWSDDEEKQQLTETMKYLCRIVHRVYDKDGSYL